MGDGPDLSGEEQDPNSTFDLGGGDDEGKESQDSQSESTQASQEGSGGSSTAVPEGEPAPGEDENWDNASKDARSRARQKDLPIVQPPAVDEEEVPVCFGDYDPDERPCGECAVEKDCQKKYLGM